MSQLLIAPALQPSVEATRYRFAAAIATTSFAALLLELALTRLFSVVLFYHFAFLAISIALLGLGAGGVFAFIGRESLRRWEARPLGARLCSMSAISIAVALEVVLHVPVSLQLTSRNFLNLTVIYLVSAIPFFFTGLLFSAVFAREKQRISQLYGADLVGGAAACMAVVPVLNLMGGPHAILLSAIAMTAAAFIWSDTRGYRTFASGAGLLLVAVIAANTAFHGRLIDIVYAKGMRRDQPWVEFSEWNAISRVEVDRQGDARAIVIDADASTYIMNADPKQWQDSVWQKNLMSAAPAVVNVLRPQGDYAIIGPGGGVDVLRAVANGSKNVTAIEINPIIANDIMRGRYADYAYHLYERPEVHLHVQDGRSYIRNSKDKYDVIQMTLVDTWASTAAGAFALSENNLYTVEAFKEYFDHLKPDGMIAITRWEFKEPREALRVVSQGIEALRQMGIADPRRHFLIVSDGPLDVDGRPVAVLVKRVEFTQEEVQFVHSYLIRNSNLLAQYLPLEEHRGRTGVQKEPCDSIRHAQYSRPESGDNAFHRLLSLTPDDWSESSFIYCYPFDISSVTDNSPYFFFTFKTGRLLDQVLHNTGQGIDWKVNLGVAVLFMLLVISALAVLAFLILPLAFHAGARTVGAQPLLYFIAVGLGYILVEITFIQRFVLFLGHPTYALTVVVFLMLLSSGLGSLAARKWNIDWRRLRLPLGVIIAGIVVHLFALPGLLGALIGLALPVKLLISALILVPVAFAMGMPFPTGLHALGSGDGTIEWAWAMNAASSVLGSVLAMIIAVHFGLGVTLACGAAAYTLAAVLSGTFRKYAVPAQ